MPTATTKRWRPKAKAEPDEGMWPYWVSDNPRLLGSPEPAWQHFNPDVDYFHGDRLGRFAHKTGHPLFGWQWDSERKILATLEDGTWAHPDVVLIITRQQGKTELVVWRILYGLFYLGEKIRYTAQRWDTVEDVYDRLVQIITERPSLRRRLKVMPGAPDGYSKAGNHGEIYTKNGGALEMGPRTRAIGRGQTKIDLGIFDEAYDIKDLHKADLTGAQKSAANPQTIYISTAAVEWLHPHCHVLAGQRRNAMRGEPDMYGAEWAAPESMAPDSVEAFRLAQPSHGITIRTRDVMSEYRGARSEILRAIYRADYLGWGVWPKDDDELKPVIDPERWRELVNTTPLLVGDICLAVERTLNDEWWAIAAGQRTLDGRVHVEVGYYRRANIGQVAAAVLELIEAIDPAAIIVDSHSHAAPLVPYMLKLGVEITVCTTPKLAVYTRGFIDSIEAGDISHMGAALVANEVENVATRELPRGDIVLDEIESGVAMAPLKAMVLVHGAVLEYAEEPKPAADPVVATPDPQHGRPHDLDVSEQSPMDMSF